MLQAVDIVATPSSSSRIQDDDQMVVDPTTPSGVHIIAHSKGAQELFDRIPLSWGVQYELARGMSLNRWSWAQVMQADLQSLKGPNNNAAARVSQAVLKQASANVTTNDIALWYVLNHVFAIPNEPFAGPNLIAKRKPSKACGEDHS